MCPREISFYADNPQRLEKRSGRRRRNSDPIPTEIFRILYPRFGLIFLVTPQKFSSAEKGWPVTPAVGGPSQDRLPS